MGFLVLAFPLASVSRLIGGGIVQGFWGLCAVDRRGSQAGRSWEGEAFTGARTEQFVHKYPS